MTVATLFTYPMTISTDVILFLVLPLLVSVAIVYKTIRVKNIRRLPLEIGILIGYMVAGLVALGVGLWLVQEYWP